MPNYKKIIDGIQSQLPVKMAFQSGSSEILTSFFAWKENFASQANKSNLDENLQRVKTIKVSIRPGRRWYRDQIPPKMKKGKSKKKKVSEKAVKVSHPIVEEDVVTKTDSFAGSRYKDEKYYI